MARIGGADKDLKDKPVRMADAGKEAIRGTIRPYIGCRPTSLRIGSPLKGTSGAFVSCGLDTCSY